MWDGFDNRKFPRIHLGCEVVIHPEGKKKAFKTRTENVGMGGVRVILDEPLERFGRCKVSLELEDSAPPMRCAGRSVWVIPSFDLKTSRKNFDTGIEFMDIDDSSRQRLQIFLKNSEKS